MIGFYNYTVILTYLSLASSTIGIFLTVNGRFKFALLCLALSGLFDMFDGKVARTKSDRTDDEKSFGIQIDSLCDAICFGIFPVILGYYFGMQSIFSIGILCFYVTAGIIRLGYYNVMEIKRQSETDDNRKYYSGLPITAVAIILPLMVLFASLFSYNNALIIVNCTMLLLGMLFIINFKMPKPKNSTLGVLIGIVSLALLKIFHIF